MTTRILPSAVSLLLCLSIARAEDVIATPISSIPLETIAPGVDTITTDAAVTEPAPGEPDVVTVQDDVTSPVSDDIKVVTYSGSEVEHGGGTVDPVLMYSSGGIMTLGGPESGSAGLDPVAAGSGLQAAAALRLDVGELVLPARELKVLDAAGDIVISD